MSSALRAAIVARDPDEISAAVYDELIPIIPNATDPATYDPRELGPSGGNVFKGVAWQGKNWWRDDTSVAAADNVTCIILLDGGHYLTNEVTFPQTVESRTVTAPPDSPGTDPSVVGKAWRVPAAATGTWAGHDDDVAMGSGRGWLFHTPGVGEEHYVRDADLYEQFRDDNAWHDREASLGAQSIPFSAFLWDGRVENQTTNAQPTTIGVGTAHIIGPSPTGAKWAGNAGKLSISEATNDVTVYTPFVGQRVFDKSLNSSVSWNGTAWIPAVGLLVAISGPYQTSSGSVTNGGVGTYAYSDSVAPTSSISYREDSITITATPKKANATHRFTYQFLNNGAALDLTIALFRDSISAAVDWSFLPVASAPNPVFIEFFDTTADAGQHTWKIRFIQSGGGLPAAPTRRKFMREEFA